MNRSFWLDEIVTVLNIDVPDLTTVIARTSHDNQPPLYNLTAFAWTRLFGYSEIAVRSLSLLYGLLALFTPWLARTSLTPHEKLLNFAILCLMTFPIRFAQEARNYSLLFLLSSSCLYAYYEFNAARMRPRPALLYAAIALLAFTHIFGVMLALSFIAVMAWREPSTRRRAGLIVFAILLAAAALGPLLHGGAAAQAGGNFWIKFGVRIVGVELLKLITPLGLGLLAYALARWRSGAVKAPLDPAVAWSLLPFAMMLVGALVVSLHTPIFTAHYLIGLIPAYALLVSWLLRPSISGTGPALVVLACSLLLVQAVVLTFSPFLFVQEDLRLIARTSMASDSRVCYVMPTGTSDTMGGVWAYYITRRFARPDLAPIVVPQSDIPKAVAARECPLWAEAHLAKRGVTILREFPQLGACRDVPLGRPGVAMASALLDCRGAQRE